MVAKLTEVVCREDVGESSNAMSRILTSLMLSRQSTDLSSRKEKKGQMSMRDPNQSMSERGEGIGLLTKPEMLERCDSDGTALWSVNGLRCANSSPAAFGALHCLSVHNDTCSISMKHRKPPALE